MSCEWRKDPDDILDFKEDWSLWLDPGDTIFSSDWLHDGGLTMVSDSYDDTTTTVWLSGGVSGQDYCITNRITTVGGRQVDRTNVVQIRKR